MNNNESLDNVVEKESQTSSNWIVKILISHTKEIISTVTIGVFVTAFSTTIIN